MSSAVTTIDPSQTFSLQEGKQDEQQDALLMDDTHAYRLVKIGKDVLVYGGVDGLLVRASDQTTVRRWEDDALRAVAVSPNQRVVAIGLDEGDVQLYDFADYQASTTTIDDAGVHPFCQLPSVNADEDDAFLSQSDLLSSPHPKDKMRAGPRADSPVRQLLFLNDDFLAIASESGLTIVHLAKDGELPTFLTAAAKEAHQGSGVRGICWNAQENLLTSLAMDGRVCYWSCPLTKDPQSWKLWRKEEDMSVAKKDSGEYLGADPWDRSCCPWQAPAEGVLAIPGSNFWQLSVWNNSRDKDETNLDRTLLFQNEPVHTKTMVVIRSKGMQWITTDRANAVVLWQLTGKQMKEMHRLDAGKGAAPTDVLWTDEKLWVVSADGRMSVWNKDVLPSPVQTDSKPMTVAIDAENEETAEKTVTTAAPVRKRLQKARSPVDKEEDDDDDDDDVDFSQPANPFIQDQAEEDNDDDSLEATLQNTTPSVRAMQEDRLGSGADDDDDDDENSFDMDQMPPPSSRVGANWGPPPPAVEAQAAFGPSSTPLEDPRRFFCWNQVGALSVRQTDPGRATVDIDFTDSAFRRPISFTDTIGFILGSLGEDGAILASDIPEDEDDEDNAIGDVVDGLNISETTKQALKKSRKQDSPTNGSTIYFHRYETFDSNRNKDWYLTLPAGERALGCATGEGWAAVVTHRRFVRLFTTGGNQGQIFWIEGDPVTMVGRSRFLAVFYHQSAPLSDGTQKMGYTLFDAVEGRIVAKGALSALSTRASLQWVGFSSESSLMAMDSDGMLSMLVSSADASTHWEWTPVLDTMALRKSTKDTHWPIHVSSGKLICIPLKGGVKYPDVARRPVTSSLGLRLPLARGSLMQVQALEELSIRASVALHQRKVVEQALNPGQEEEEEEFAKEYHALSAQVDKVTLKLFASIVEAGKLERALDLVERLHLERSFDLAMTIADRHRKLVDRIENVKELKFPVDEEDNAGEESYLSATDSPLETNSRDFSSITPDAEAGRSKRAFWAEEGSRKVRRTADA